MTILTKSKYLNGLQCHRLLWFANKKLLPEISLSDEHKFSQGHGFEEYVKQLYPDAIDLNGLDFQDNIKKTKLAISKKKTVFEAGFQYKDLYVRSDLLIPNGNKYELYEIKSTTESKPHHIPDLAFQKYVLEKCGITISQCYIIYLNKEYKKDGKIDPQKLITKEEVTGQVDLIDDIKEKAKIFQEILNLKTYDDIPISPNCNKPYECPLKKQCWATLPENNVLQLTNWRVYWKLFNEGIKDIKDIPKETKLSDKDEIIIESLKKSPYISKEHIKHFIKALNYPLYHFDFETFDTAVPIYNNSKPYQKIPFQYSLHIEQEDGKTKHKEFLAEGNEDPRIPLLKQLKEDIGTFGDIIVYNKGFEKSVLTKLSEDFPENEEWLKNAISRLVDLADIFRAFYYYDKSQKGSYSIKKVLPAVTKHSYDNLEIANGGDASMLYFYSHIIPNLKNKEEIRNNLKKYCKLDTEGMVWILQKLKLLQD